jgi:hypothetical protein
VSGVDTGLACLFNCIVYIHFHQMP